MTQFAFPTIEATVHNGSQLSDWLNQFVPSVWTQHAGPTRPSYVQPGMLWVDTSVAGTHQVKVAGAAGDAMLASVTGNKSSFFAASVTAEYVDCSATLSVASGQNSIVARADAGYVGLNGAKTHAGGASLLVNGGGRGGYSFEWFWQGAPIMVLDAVGNLGAGRFQSPAAGGAQLLCLNAANQISFDWAAVGAPRFFIDGTVNGYFATASNCKELAYAAGGGPVSAVLNGRSYDNGLWSIFVDAASDERIKSNIRDTEVDVLAVLRALPVRAFEVTGDVAAWYATIGQPDAERAAAREVAADEPVPIGFVAQEVAAAGIPEAVHIQQEPQPEGSPLPEGMQSIVHQLLVPYLWRVAQIQDERIAALTARLDALEAAA